jgi:hypothetical protein
VDARVRVVADVAGALIQIHDNSGLPRPHRRHGRVTPRHILVGVDGSASLFHAKEPFSKLLPPQPDLGYLAPELLTQSAAANQQSDVFSLGVLLWEALDNGRLFPHRRAAAISRLIARRSLPAPRIEEEWAMPLAEVALKALLPDPPERYADATAFWLALREHLPAPDNARGALARLAQRALKLELTAEIREVPPYLAPSPLASLGPSLPPERISFTDYSQSEIPARYSLRPEPSSRAASGGATSTAPSTGNAQHASHWPLDSRAPPAAPRFSTASPRSPSIDSRAPEARASSSRSSPESPGPSGPPVSPTPVSSRSPEFRTPVAQRAVSLAPSQRPVAQQSTSPWQASQRPTPVSLPPVPWDAPMQASAAANAPASQPPLSTLHVNLPRELVDTALPLYPSSDRPPRPFPWGALSFAALVFFGVGAAVAFGAVTALRTMPREAREPSPERPALEAQPSAPSRTPAPAAEAPPIAASSPALPELTAPAPSTLAPTLSIPPTAAPVAALPRPDTDGDTAATAVQSAVEAESREQPPRRAARRAPKPAKPKHVAPKPLPAAELVSAPPAEPAQPEPEPVAPPDEGLPFVEQPY